MERTLTILKPDAVAAGHAGAILAHLEKEGFRLIGVRKLRLSPEQARAFYAVHRERPFYGAPGHVHDRRAGHRRRARAARTRSPHLRRTMGATDSRKAEPGTVRQLFGTDIERNAIHGSDSADNAAKRDRLLLLTSPTSDPSRRPFARAAAREAQRHQNPVRDASQDRDLPRRERPSGDEPSASRAASGRGVRCRRSRSPRGRGPSGATPPRSPPRGPAARKRGRPGDPRRKRAGDREDGGDRVRDVHRREIGLGRQAQARRAARQLVLGQAAPLRTEDEGHGRGARLREKPRQVGEPETAGPTAGPQGGGRDDDRVGRPRPPARSA